MARTTSAKKAQRVALRRRVFNLRRKKEMKDSAKAISKRITAKDMKGAETLLPAFQRAVDKAAKGGVIKKNAAARMTSRIVKKIRAISV